MNTLKAIFNIERKIVDTGVIIFISALSIMVITQVVFRYVLHTSLSWSEELSRYCQVWMVMLGSVILIRKKGHLAIDIISASMPPKAKYFTDIIIHVSIIVFFTIVTYYGVGLTQNAARQFSAGMQIQMCYVYAALPVGGALILLEEIPIFINHLIHGFPHKKAANPKEEEVNSL